MVSDDRVAHDLVSEDHQAQVVDVLYAVLLHVHTVLQTQGHGYTQCYRHKGMVIHTATQTQGYGYTHCYTDTRAWLYTVL